MSGSQWRKWDLHVHTPESIENHYKGTNQEEKWERFIAELEQLPAEVKVIGINDYLFIDGYRKVLEYKKLGRLSNIEAIFPVIEFRIKKFAGNRDFKRVNFHVIFSDEISCDRIQEQFLNTLQSKYKLAPGLTGIEWNASVTKDSLSDLGKRIKATVPPDQLRNFDSDLVEGFYNLNLDEEEIIRTLKDNSYLKAHHILAVGKTEWDSLSWGESSIAEKKDIINKVDLVFISSKTIPDYMRAREKLIEQGVNHRLLDCSDAHYFMDSEEKDKIGKCFSWIKADTTFSGLRQAILEFDERVFVGDRPPILVRVHDNPTKYIKSLSIKKIAESTMPEIWFDGIEAIPINSQLVTIIGNKGSGKSAIADIIGMLGNSHNYQYNSFLHPNKFLKKKPIDRAASFVASMLWNSGLKTEELSLATGVDETVNEKVKYLPQNYLEKICSDEVEGENFERELKAVVFSHMGIADRLGQRSFEEYLDYQSSEIRSSIETLRATLHNINIEIVEMENKLHPNYIKSIQEKIKAKKEELSAHQQIKPREVEAPAEESTYITQHREHYERLKLLQENKETISQEIARLNETEISKKKQVADLDLYCARFSEVDKYLQTLILEYRKPLEEYGISIDEVIRYTIDTRVISENISKQKAVLAEIDGRLDVFSDESLPNQLSRIEEEIGKITSELSEPYQKYHAYLTDLEEWKYKESEIIGNSDAFESLSYYEEELSFVTEELEQLLKEKEEERRRTTIEIYDKKDSIITLYKTAYEPVMHLIREYSDIMGEFGLSFDAMLKNNGFETGFLDRINQGVKGSFCGKDDGYVQLQRVMDEAEFGSTSGVSDFLSKVLEMLKKDCREGREKETRYVSEQLKKEASIEEFYDFLFGLDFLIPTYRLRLGEKELIELSPGERGALLLIFYLLLDKSDIPLIIDQPEENLDNQSVYDIVVKFIKKAKERRQVIIITHNPNLAVVCDSDQVIRVKIDKNNKNKFTWVSGAIENKGINDEIVRILEGTMPAFWNRRVKYENANR